MRRLGSSSVSTTNAGWSARAAGLALAVAGGLVVACSPRPMPARHAGDDARAFVQAHRGELQAEISAGSGPRIYDLAIVANCQDVFQLSRRLHRNQEKLLPADASDAEAADRVVRFMGDNRDLRCLGLDASRSGDLAGGRRHIGPRRSQVIRRGGSS